MRFDNWNACLRLEEVLIVCFDSPKVCRQLVEIRRVRFDNRNACLRLEVQRVCFHFHKVCRRRVEVRSVFEACRSLHSPFCPLQSVY